MEAIEVEVEDHGGVLLWHGRQGLRHDGGSHGRSSLGSSGCGGGGDRPRQGQALVGFAGGEADPGP
eukprot:6467741-Pyramimonas_sp.AAC.1